MSAELLASADAVANQVLNAIANEDEDIVVDSPPGAGKTRLLEDATGFVALVLELTVMVGCSSNDQADDATGRIARAFPNLPIDRFVARGEGRPLALVGLPNVNIVDDPMRLSAPVTVATVAKYGEVDGLNGPRDFLFLDEAYQIKNADYLRIRDMAGRTVAIGDPGQIDPITKTSVRHYASDPQGPHVAAPKAMLAANVARRFVMPLSRRLPQDTVEIVQPAFYRRLPFEGVAEAWERYIDPCAHGSTQTDHLLDQALAVGSLSMISLPEAIVTSVDPEIVDLIGDMVDRLVVRQFHVFDGDDHERPITPDDIGVVAFRKHQVAAIRARLGSAYRGVHVETANRFQGLEKKVILSLHTLSGKQRLDGFSTEGGRMCVASSRHRVNCIIIGRDGIQGVLDRFSPDEGRFLGQVEDPYFAGWQAHSTFARLLEERNAIIRP